MNSEEYSLVCKAIRGKSEAYGELIKIYNPYFYKVAFLYVKNEEVAMEIVQDSVCHGFLKIGFLRNPEYFSTWMVRIIMNKAARYLSKSKKFVDYDESIERESHNEHLEERLDIHYAINRLPKKYKDVIILKYFYELSVSEIASKQHLPENTVKSYLARARSRLRKLLKEDYFEYS